MISISGLLTACDIRSGRSRVCFIHLVVVCHLLIETTTIKTPILSKHPRATSGLSNTGSRSVQPSRPLPLRCQRWRFGQPEMRVISKPAKAAVAKKRSHEVLMRWYALDWVHAVRSTKFPCAMEKGHRGTAAQYGCGRYGKDYLSSTFLKLSSPRPSTRIEFSVSWYQREPDSHQVTVPP